MIVLDTHVVSELMRTTPAGPVLAWFASHDAATLFLTAITEAELRTGAAFPPAGKRRDAIIAAIDAMIEEDFAGRVLPFDGAAAKTYAIIVAERRATGRPVVEADCQIAAIARAHGAGVATRNVGDFEGCGIGVINPWDHP